MTRWVAYGLMSVSLAAAVFLYGGVHPREWEWCALGLSLGALAWVVAPKRERAPGGTPGLILLAALLAWMLFQLVPLPPSLVGWLSPERWQNALDAREATNADPAAWMALSVDPMATIERLLYVLPAMAVFVAAREMAWQWSGSIWIAFAPVVLIAWLESVLGLAQFYAMRMQGAVAGSATGTYVNRNHFAGLLEMALPIAAMWAVATWRRNTTRHEQPLRVGLAVAAIVGMSGCILMSVVLSLSRMAFLSTLMASGVTLVLLLSSLGSSESRWNRWRWAIPVVAIVLVAVFLPTRELVDRFASMASTEEVNEGTRIGIWRNTLSAAADYRWAGCGLGAYESCLYAYKTAAPVNRVDFAHNDYLQSWSELGLPGGLLALALAGWILWRPLTLVVTRRGSKDWIFAIGLLGSLLAIGLHSLADFNLYIPANAAAFAWLCGVAVSPGLRGR